MRPRSDENPASKPFSSATSLHIAAQRDAERTAEKQRGVRDAAIMSSPEQFSRGLHRHDGDQREPFRATTPRNLAGEFGTRERLLPQTGKSAGAFVRELVRPLYARETDRGWIRWSSSVWSGYGRSQRPPRSWLWWITRRRTTTPSGLEDVFPANPWFLEWRDPDSNRGHHDFQLG